MAEKTVTIKDTVTVGSLADALGIPATQLIAELFKNGIPATINEKLDFDTAVIVSAEIAPDIELEKEIDEVVVDRTRRTLVNEGELRPPVVAVMGHVDHGKTTLLDAIRKADTAAKEAGGITQHISAYQITWNDRVLTFLDTPGHEAFASLREHGAQLTDIAVIVVAADDGVKPQTKEAIRYAQQAGVKIIVAVTKIDKESADINRTKQQLAEENILIEEWGGDTVVVGVSGKTGEGLDQLLDMLLLVTDVEELRAPVNVPAEGLIIESHVEHGRGPVVTMLVEQGTIRLGDAIVAGDASGKVKTLQTTDGKSVKEATPSTPVVISGFKTLPEFGEVCRVVVDGKVARSQAAAHAISDPEARNGSMTSNELIKMINKKKSQVEMNVVVKADVQGSLTSVIDSLKSLENDEVALRVIGTGVGNISEGDVHLASTSGAIIYGFNVELPTPIKRIAARDGVRISLFKVIYELLDTFKAEASARLSPETVETEVGVLEVAGIFRTSKTEIICGGKVLKGKAVPNVIARIERKKEVLGEARVSSVKRGTVESKEVFEGDMCGLQLELSQKVAVEVGDKITFLTRELVARTL